MRQPAIVVRVNSLFDEVFSFEDNQGQQHHWNVTEARRLAEARGDLQPISLNEYGITAAFIRSQYTNLDEDYALTTDLSRPILFIPLGDKLCIADGWHRLFRAAMEGTDILSAYFLTREEANTCLVCTLPPGCGIDWGQPCLVPAHLRP